MVFTRLTAVGGTAAKGRWGMLIEASVNAKMRQVAATAAQRVAGAGNGKATLSKNKEALAKALANIPASRAPHASSPKATPANATANKARLDALLADKD
jgi:hypothetical protein